MSWLKNAVHKVSDAASSATSAVTSAVSSAKSYSVDLVRHPGKIPGAAVTTLNMPFQVTKLAVSAVAPKQAANFELGQAAAENHPVQVGMVGAGAVLVATGAGSSAGAGLIARGATQAIGDQMQRDADAAARDAATREGAVTGEAPPSTSTATAPTPGSTATATPAAPLTFFAWLRSLVAPHPKKR